MSFTPFPLTSNLTNGIVSHSFSRREYYQSQEFSGDTNRERLSISGFTARHFMTALGYPRWRLRCLSYPYTNHGLLHNLIGRRGALSLSPVSVPPRPIGLLLQYSATITITAYGLLGLFVPTRRPLPFHLFIFHPSILNTLPYHK